LNLISLFLAGLMASIFLSVAFPAVAQGQVPDYNAEYTRILRQNPNSGVDILKREAKIMADADDNLPVCQTAEPVYLQAAHITVDGYSRFGGLLCRSKDGKKIQVIVGVELRVIEQTSRNLREQAENIVFFVALYKATLRK